MKTRVTVLFCSLWAALAWPQSRDQIGLEPSPMEAFASTRGVRRTWAEEVGRWEHDDSRLVLTAVVLENDTPYTRRVRGVKIDLSSTGNSDRIYLDEQATERTRSALQEISDAVGTGGVPGGCMGAREFWPLYNWPWNKYHELNADYCGDKENFALVLYGRGNSRSFRFLGKKPTDLEGILVSAMAKLKQH